MESEVIIQLRNLRNKYGKGLVSVLVGAGFSRNACEEYPLWQGLLYDMAVELYSDKIEKAYISLTRLNPRKKITLPKFTLDEVPRIINRVGYLKMVSEYIARKGFREAIEHYIEERVPYIDSGKQKFRYVGKNRDKEIDIVPEHFAAHRKLLEGSRWERIYTTNYDRLLEYAVAMDDKTYKVITRARDLSVSKETPSIIKLHGDLHNPLEGERKFVFDGNPHHQYIISQEDYDTYPQKHEAFTQLMRISLLQGAFCLIGFSGDDPNFINWINWVRDVLVTEDESGNNRSRYKIFLVGLSKDAPDEVRQIFYDNHNIFYIPLLQDGVKQEIGATGTDEPRSLFCKLFAYLYRGDAAKQFTWDEDEVLNRKEYADLWNTIYSIEHTGIFPKDFKRVVTIDKDKMDRLMQLKVYNRLVSSNYMQVNYLRDVVCKDSLTEDEARLALLALSDTGISVDDALIKKIEESGIDAGEMTTLENLVDRTITLCYSKYEETVKSRNVYEEILRALFLLDYKRAKELVRDWTPEGADCLKKSAVTALFDKEGAKEMLTGFIKSNPIAKEQFYATRLLNMLEDSFPQAHSTTRFENANVQDYFKLLSNLVRRVIDKKNKVEGYGDSKNKKVIYMDGKPSKKPEALAVLNFLIEAPAFVSYRNFYTLINATDWYWIHKELFESYPLPTLYYSLQCTDAKVKKRIGQDYAYSDILVANCLGNILKRLLQAYLSDDTPDFQRVSILQVAQEMFVSVKTAEWENSFMEIWEKVVLKYRFVDAESRRFDELDKFVNKALNSLKSLPLRQIIISDVLKNVKADTYFAINCLYYLHVVPSDLKGDDTTQAAIQAFVSGIDTPSELNVAGNIFRLLTDEQKDVCSDKCLTLLDASNNSISDLVYQVSQFFVKDDAEKRKVFVKSVCNNALLWGNGVIDDNTMGDFKYLKLSGFMRRVYIDQEALEEIYSKMRNSAGQLTGFIDRHGRAPFFSDVDGLLSEMLTFMNYYKRRLAKEDDYESLYALISQTYYEVSGLRNIEDGLLSPYEEEMIQSIQYMYQNRDVLMRKDIVFNLDMLIKRVLLKNGDGLDTCIAYLSYFLRERLITMDDSQLIDGLMRVVERYTKEDVLECNMDLVLTTRSLGRIADFLKDKGRNSTGIDYWLDFKKKSRFYSNFD